MWQPVWCIAILQPQEKKADSVKTNADVLLTSYTGQPQDTLFHKIFMSAYTESIRH